jgi:SAM-dependent methyltransferase
MEQSTGQRASRLKFESAAICPMCGSNRLQYKFDVRHVTGDAKHDCALELGYTGSTVVSCRECSFLFKVQRPPASYLYQHYAGSGEAYLSSLAEEHSGIREDFNVARKLLMEAFPRGGTILDVGCASAFFLESLGEKWNRYGIELFHLAAEQARKRRGIIVHESELLSARFAEKSFDVVCTFDVLEHLSDPMPIFREARRILKPGGWLLLGTGDSSSFTARLAGSRWTYVCIPEHLSFFNPDSLRKGLSAAGFEHFEFKRIHHGERHRSVTRGWMRAVGKHWALKFFGKDILRLGVFHQKTTDFLVPYLFDHLMCIAS